MLWIGVDEGSVLSGAGREDVALAGFEIGECASPSGAVEGGALAVLGLDLVA